MGFSDSPSLSLSLATIFKPQLCGSWSMSRDSAQLDVASFFEYLVQLLRLSLLCGNNSSRSDRLTNTLYVEET